MLLLARASVAMFGLLAGAVLPAAETTDIEQRVKAAFLFNFARFVTWPEEKFAGPRSPIVLCVRSDDALAPALAAALQGKAIEERALVLRTPSHPADWSACHIAYLGTHPDEPGAPGTLAGGAVLTVHEAEAALSGGIVRFYIEDRKLRFEVNTTAAREARLRISSRLLDLAAVVEK